MTDYVEPRYPLTPLAVADEIAAKVPGLPDLFAAHTAAMSAYHAAVDAVEEHEDGCRRARAARATALAAASRATADGRARPKIPAAPSEVAEAEEQTVLHGVVDIRRGEADAVARRIDALIGDHAELIAAHSAVGYSDAVGEAKSALGALRDALGRVQAVRGEVVSARALGAARAAGVPRTSPAMAHVARAFLLPLEPFMLRALESRGGVASALSDLNDAVNAFGDVDLSAAPDVELLPGPIQHVYAERRLPAVADPR